MGELLRFIRANLSKIILTLAILSLALTWFYSVVLFKNRDITGFLPDIVNQEATFERNDHLSSAKHSIFTINGTDGELLGYVTATEGPGYGGPMVVMVYWSAEGVMQDIIVPIHHEDEAWWRSLENKGYFEQYSGKSYDTSLILDEDIDSISGATVSSNGVIIGVREGRQIISKHLEDPYPQEDIKVDFGLPEIMLVLGFVLVLAFRSMPALKRKKWPRYFSLLYGFVVLGVWLSVPLAVTNIATWFIGYAPHFQTSLIMYILVFGFIGLALIFGKNYYCFWICPFAAVQEGANFIGGMGVKASRSWRKLFSYARYFLLWLSVLLVLLAHSPSVSIFEPWNTLFSAKGSVLQWAVLIVAVSASIFIYNFWCIYLCPVGAFMDITLKIRKGTLKLWGKLARREK